MAGAFEQRWQFPSGARNLQTSRPAFWASGLVSFAADPAHRPKKLADAVGLPLSMGTVCQSLARSDSTGKMELT